MIGLKFVRNPDRTWPSYDVFLVGPEDRTPIARIEREWQLDGWSRGAGTTEPRWTTTFVDESGAYVYLDSGARLRQYDDTLGEAKESLETMLYKGFMREVEARRTNRRRRAQGYR